MIEFEVKSKKQPIGKRKGQMVYYAQPKTVQHLTNKMRPLQNLHPLNFHPYTLRRMNIFDQKMPLEVTF